jgi:LytS/YehU family sensor histidine kinase
VEVPVLLLQPIVENAVKHGLSSLASGGKVWIKVLLREETVEMMVEDNGVGFGKSPYSGSGTALGNCRKRLDLAYGPQGNLAIREREGGGTQIIMRLPAGSAGKMGGEK